MDQKKGLMIAAVAAGAYYLYTNSGGPAFRNMSGQVVTEILCGNSVTFDVPGYSEVWLQRLKDGILDFNGMYALPMPAYVMSCSADVGVYDLAVYKIDANGAKGELIGQTRFTVLPSA